MAGGMFGPMPVSLDRATSVRVDALTRALERQAAAQDRLAAAIEAHTALLDVAHNGPRG